mmetsp:Transcript_11268/g.29857  ORF Transcript_11268/g.29857 Transcript_11268/m.29857 type:complete len:297 (-) Transcript_11268:650-1540(-)
MRSASACLPGTNTFVRVVASAQSAMACSTRLAAGSSTVASARARIACTVLVNASSRSLLADSSGADPPGPAGSKRARNALASSPASGRISACSSISYTRLMANSWGPPSLASDGCIAVANAHSSSARVIPSGVQSPSSQAWSSRCFVHLASSEQKTAPSVPRLCPPGVRGAASSFRTNGQPAAARGHAMVSEVTVTRAGFPRIFARSSCSVTRRPSVIFSPKSPTYAAMRCSAKSPTTFVAATRSFHACGAPFSLTLIGVADAMLPSVPRTLVASASSSASRVLFASSNETTDSGE